MRTRSVSDGPIRTRSVSDGPIRTRSVSDGPCEPGASATGHPNPERQRRAIRTRSVSDGRPSEFARRGVDRRAHVRAIGHETTQCVCEGRPATRAERFLIRLCRMDQDRVSYLTPVAYAPGSDGRVVHARRPSLTLRVRIGVSYTPAARRLRSGFGWACRSRPPSVAYAPGSDGRVARGGSSAGALEKKFLFGTRQTGFVRYTPGPPEGRRAAPEAEGHGL